MRKLMILLTVIFLNVPCTAQEGLWKFGLQFRPGLPVNFINAGDDISTEDNVTYTNTQRFGRVMGALMRYNITNGISFETGILFNQRNYSITLDSLENNFESTVDYRIVGYEIPLTAMVFVQLDREIFMSAALGGSINFFPSDVSSSDPETELLHETVRYRWVQSAVVANLGFEYRSRGVGTFYVGGSFHLPFSPIFLSKIGFARNPLTQHTIDIQGTYLTLDFRFYFPEMSKSKKQ